MRCFAPTRNRSRHGGCLAQKQKGKQLQPRAVCPITVHRQWGCENGLAMRAVSGPGSGVRGCCILTLLLRTSCAGPFSAAGVPSGPIKESSAFCCAITSAFQHLSDTPSPQSSVAALSSTWLYGRRSRACLWACPASCSLQCSCCVKKPTHVSHTLPLSCFLCFCLHRAVWQALPRVFVGMPCQLQSAVQLLCEEMELSFLEAGRPCPPWRGWAATINRWMSDQFMDVLVPEPGRHWVCKGLCGNRGA